MGSISSLLREKSLYALDTEICKFNVCVKKVGTKTKILLDFKPSRALVREMHNAGYDYKETECNTRYETLFLQAGPAGDLRVTNLSQSRNIIPASEAKLLFVDNMVEYYSRTVQTRSFIIIPARGSSLDYLTVNQILAKLPGSIIVERKVNEFGGDVILWKRIENPTLRALPLSTIITMVNSGHKGGDYLVPPKEVYSDDIDSS
jgi:hypothetical protein